MGIGVRKPTEKISIVFEGKKVRRKRKLTKYGGQLKTKEA